MNQYMIEITKTKVKVGHHFDWILWSGNGKKVATNPKSFKRLNDLTKTLAALKKEMGTARVFTANELTQGTESQAAEEDPPTENQEASQPQPQ